jgi:hypothetical protein
MKGILRESHAAPQPRCGHPCYIVSSLKTRREINYQPYSYSTYILDYRPTCFLLAASPEGVH